MKWLPDEAKKQLEAQKTKEWKKHIDHDMFDMCPELTEASLKAQGKNVLKMRYVITDKAETRRAGQTVEEVPMELKARLVTPGFADTDNLAGKLKKDAPTLPAEAVGVILQCAASKKWKIAHTDVEAAFLSGAYFSREIYVSAPFGGLPPVGDQAAVPAGTVMRLKKSMPGLADAPLEW